MSDPVLPRLSDTERDARDSAFDAREQRYNDRRVWNEAWQAARARYAPNADLANDLRERLGIAGEC